MLSSWFTRAPPQAAGPASPPSPPILTVTARFPRATGPDTDRPVATAHWPTAEEAARLVGPWQPGKFLIGRDHQGRYYGIEDDRHILTVADDGRGLPEGFDPDGGRSLGLKIVRTMASQIGGDFSMIPQGKGVACQLHFPAIEA